MLAVVTHNSCTYSNKRRQSFYLVIRFKTGFFSLTKHSYVTGLSEDKNPNLKSSIICGRIVKTSCCIVVTLIHRYRLIFDSNMMINDTMDGHQSSLRTKINNGWLTFQLCNEKLLITLCLLFVCIFTWFNGKRNFDRLAIFWLVIWLLSLIFTTSVQ